MQPFRNVETKMVFGLSFFSSFILSKEKRLFFFKSSVIDSVFDQHLV